MNSRGFLVNSRHFRSSVFVIVWKFTVPVGLGGTLVRPLLLLN